MDKCPFCGAPKDTEANNPNCSEQYLCGTMMYDEFEEVGAESLRQTFYDREPDCYERQISTLQADLAESEKWQKQFFDDLQDSINKRIELEADLAHTRLEVEAFLKKYNCKRAYAAWQKL